MAAYYNEIDSYCCKVLRKHIADGSLPDGYVDERDIREVRASDLVGFNQIHLFAGIGGFPLACQWAGWPDDASIITGGFPCQPFSLAGNRLGMSDNRFLWPEMLRLIGAAGADYVVAENVYGFLNIDGGMSAELLCADMENNGYERPAILDTASCAWGIPTMERHIWFISKAAGKRCKRREADAHPNNRNEGQFQRANTGGFIRRNISEAGFCGVGERVSTKLDKYQREQLIALGNSVPPHVAYEIIRVIREIDSMCQRDD